MDREALVAEQFTADLEAGGRAVVEGLDAANLSVSAAFWLLAPGEASWRLVVVSPLVAALGPRAFYKKVDKVLRRLEPPTVPIDVINAAPPSHPLVSLLRGAVQTGSNLGGIRFMGNVINGVLIPDAYIYRMQ
jgi:hypothetical protein